MPEPMVGAAAKMLTSTAMAGIVGSAISLRFTSKMDKWERITAVISGAIMAQYCSPLAAHILALENFQDALGFFIGLFGLSLTAAIYENIKKADIWGLIAARFAPKAGGQ